MILRAGAALALLLGSGTLLLYMYEMGKIPVVNPEAEHLRAMKDRLQAPDSIAAITFAEFAALPSGLPLSGYADLEKRGVALEGYVHSMVRSSDGDFYLHLTPEQHLRWTEQPYVVTELTPQWRHGSRRWRFEALDAELQPHIQAAPPWPDGPRRARVSGWLMYDYQYDDRLPPRRRPGRELVNALTGKQRRPSPRISAWEIHPVTRIEVWDEARGAYREVPR